MSKKVLVIESDAGFSQELQGALKKKGFQVTATDDWNAGLEMARGGAPDLFLVSVELPPPANGYSVCTKLKKDDGLKHIPVVLMSANATPETFEKHKKLKTRAEDYIIKPFKMDELFEKVGALVGMPEVEEEVVADEATEESIDADEVEEVVTGDEAPIEEETLAGDADLDALDHAFDSIAPKADPDVAPPAEKREAEAALRSAPAFEGEASAASAEAMEKIADLEGKVAALEEMLAQREAELEGEKARKSDAHAVRAELTRRDKEILRLKEELNAKEREQVELKEKLTALEEKVDELESELAKKEALLKTGAKREEEKKKLEKDLAAERKRVQELQGQLAEAEARAEEAGEAAVQLERAQAAARAAAEEVEKLKKQVADLTADVARNEERVVKAYQKIKGEEKLKEKTKKALQIALQLLDEQQVLDEDESVSVG